VRIRSARCRPYALPLRQPWRSAHGQIRERKGLLVELVTECHHYGYGDAAPLPALGSETLDQSARWLARQLPALSGLSPSQALSRLEAASICPSARCGLETAMLDLLAQQRELPLRRLLRPQAAEELEVNASLGPLDAEASARLRHTPGFRVYKLKVGLAPVADELALLYRVAAQLPFGVVLRLDANRAWPPNLAQAFLAGLEGLPVESVEEPLVTPTLQGLRALQRVAPCALALDESLAGFDLARLLERPSVRRLVLKPTLQGGLLPCLAIARRAQLAEVEVLVTTTVDSAAGTWAAAHLAAALYPPGAGPAHGLATSGWLAGDLGQPPPIEHGLLRLPQRSGLGFRPA